MNNFIKEFPSLKGKISWEKKEHKHPNANISYELYELIQKCCLDKQRVKEARLRLFNKLSEEDKTEYQKQFWELDEELGIK